MLTDPARLLQQELRHHTSTGGPAPGDFDSLMAAQLGLNYRTASVNQRESQELTTNPVVPVREPPQVIDVSLNKSHMTMEDNNKVHKKQRA
jgi:hypothetical protein